ncbi:DmsC/YnfH family molybdoenzyme membrane anchor subunit [Desulfoscipio gibsoniae]|uniref:Formate-dependent nitrite reductase, membrane component n=1 Tax=Desulfoscipio gibsoniae DSM 7213 TaxID=767817 RepID=R4KDI8_9FIRM|nr:DmsC/YnfH family molybdoenzyme membrane anchor subunit [Desulfoscipio gibsoniae]AGL00644.1 formate-dependent nitrite reductase, membrane component [Desulfoscipio gibsoniae DSM 7213]
MTAQSVPIVEGNEFVMGFRKQTVWTQWIALAFFFGKIGAGIFILSVFLGTPLLALAGILIENIGKGGALLIHLGRPERFWRALTRPSTSWIARTVWVMGIFTAIAAIYLLLPTGSAAWEFFRILALVSAVLVAVTDGFVMNDSPAIPLWNTPMIPFLFILYSILGGTTVFFFLVHGGWVTVNSLINLETLAITLILINLIGVATYLLSVVNATAAARESLLLLIKGPYSKMFFGFVVCIGFLFTLFLSLFVGASGGTAVVGLITLADLIGHFFIFYLLLQAGVYSPVLGKLTI